MTVNTKKPRHLVNVKPRRAMRAKYDAAQTTANNRNHWINADLLSADAAASPDVRRRLRSRSRYEVGNNTYAKGIVLTLANDTVGMGPRLQMLTDDKGLNRDIEREFSFWSNQIDFAGKLRTIRMAGVQDGELFVMLVNNANLENDIKLDMALYEADQVATPTFVAGNGKVDGIEYDIYGNPTMYHLLDQHPGGDSVLFSSDFRNVPAKSMIHWYRVDRPGLSRGLPELLPALPLFAQLRRYTLAVVSAAESAANFAVMMTTSMPPNAEAASVDKFAEWEFERNMATFMPEGWTAQQMKAEQPTNTYKEFKQELLNEIARCLNMPYNVAAGNSSSYNYASGRLDHQTYFKSISVVRADLERKVLDRIFSAWMAEASRVMGLTGLDNVPHQWFWDGREHVDPAKEANAQATRLQSLTTSLNAEYARQGKDWEVELTQIAKEQVKMKELGLIAEQAAPSPQDDKDDDK